MGPVSRLQYAGFRIIPYLARFPDHIPVTSLLDNVELEDIQLCSEGFPPADEPPNDLHSMNYFTQQPIIFLSLLLSMSINIPFIQHTPPPPPTLISRKLWQTLFSFALVSSWFLFFDVSSQFYFLPWIQIMTSKK